MRREISRTEKSLERVRGDYQAEGKHSLLTAKEIKEQHIRQLAQGDSVPFKYRFVVELDASEDGLISKTRQIEAAFSQMGTPNADKAEALYDGSNHNLIGVRNFLFGTLQLAVLLGTTRAGKSAFMCDLLSQTDPYYDFTLIIEEGLSHGIWTQAQGGIPIAIQPDGDVCFNYLDTQGAPLTNLQITTAAALVAKHWRTPRRPRQAKPAAGPDHPVCRTTLQRPF